MIARRGLTNPPIIGRRDLVGATIATIAYAGSVGAQEAGWIYRLGHLGLTAESERLSRELTLPELAKLGFLEGRNLMFDGAFGAVPALPALLRTMLTAKPDVIIAIGDQATRAARDATASVPIVMFADDPVGLGVAESLARPGGNVTGIAIMVDELQAKRLELLIEAIPTARRVAALLKASSPTRAPIERLLRELASRSGLELIIVTAEGSGDYAAAFAAMRVAGAESLLIGNDPQFYADAAQLIALARAARLPTSCEWADMARTGCVIGFGPSRPELRRRLAHHVARIFRGASPAEMPIEQPTLFELAINLAAARALSLTIPTLIVQRADEVIE